VNQVAVNLIRETRPIDRIEFCLASIEVFYRRTPHKECAPGLTWAELYWALDGGQKALEGLPISGGTDTLKEDATSSP